MNSEKESAAVEVVIIVVIIGLSAAIAIPNFTYARNKAWNHDQPIRDLAHFMAKKGIDSVEPLNLGNSWYYLSASATNSYDVIASFVKENGFMSVHPYAIKIHRNYGNWPRADWLTTIYDELAITNGYFVFVEKQPQPELERQATKPKHEMQPF